MIKSINGYLVIWRTLSKKRDMQLFNETPQFIRQTQQLGLFQGFVAAEELLLACIPKVKMLHLLFDTSKRFIYITI